MGFQGQSIWHNIFDECSEISIQKDSSVFFEKKILFIYFLETGEGREKEKERNVNVRQKHRSVVSCMYSDWGPNL